jgi:cyanophycin synthetase
MEAIKIIDYKAFHGRNVYSHTPVFQLNIDIGNYCDIPTNAIINFNENLLSTFPNLRKHTCSLGYEGGFLKRLEEGTYLGHVLEHVIIDFQNEAGFKVKYGKTISSNKQPFCTLFFEYENEECVLECCYGAVDMLNSLIEGNKVDKLSILKRIELLKEEVLLGPSTAALIAEAKKRNIPVCRIGSNNLIRLGYGNKSRLMQATLSDSASCIAMDICSDKHLTKKILSQFSIPVPHGYIVKSENSAVSTARRVGLPVAIKPLEANQGKGVSINLRNERDIRAAYNYALKYSNNVIVESYIKGNDYRILVVGGKISAVSQRIPPMVEGDGIHSVRELVEIINSDNNRGNGHEKPLTKIKLDDSSLTLFKRKGICPDYIPEKNQIIVLRQNGNLSTGGIAIDCTDIIHPDNAAIAIKCAKALDMDIAGIDMITKNISESILVAGGAVIEVNAAPGIRMHLYPSEGKPRNVAKDIISLLYPNQSDADFPIISVTGTNGKTTTVRLATHILSLTGKNVGMTCTSGSYIKGECIKEGDNSGYISAQEILFDKTVEAAVFETARGGILKKGLGYDLANVGVITNITEDHLCLDGVSTIEEMANVKSLVVEAIKPNGYAVLNAEDETTNNIIKNVTAQIIYFYTDINNVKVNLNKARKLVYVEEGIIKICDDGQIIEVEKISEIPLTFSGLSDCNIKNCLAATASVYALNVSPEIIAKGLRTFVYNSGRFEIYDMNQYKIMLDYGHNIAAYEEVIKFCNKINHKRLVGIIGVPGDRTNSSVKKIGQLAANSFQKVYIKEDNDLRNRTKNEIANILYETINKEKNNIKIIESEDEVTALKDAIINVKRGDFIVVLYEKLKPLLDLINKYKEKFQERTYN